MQPLCVVTDSKASRPVAVLLLPPVNAKTATSPIEAEPLKYLRPEDKKIMNRNSLFEESKNLIDQNNDFVPPEECKFKLSGKPLKDKMVKVLEKLYNEKVILDHGMHVGTELANVLSGGDTTIEKVLVMKL